jgi:hypothetical protein
MNSLPDTKGRILIIDDDTDFLELAEKMLAGHYEVSLAKSGKQALEGNPAGSVSYGRDGNGSGTAGAGTGGGGLYCQAETGRFRPGKGLLHL